MEKFFEDGANHAAATSETAYYENANRQRVVIGCAERVRILILSLFGVPPSGGSGFGDRRTA
jgi:hypothetical protein